MLKLYGYIIDYKDENGRDMHGSFQAVVPSFGAASAGQEDDLAEALCALEGVLNALREKGLKPMFAFHVRGIHQMDELERIAETPNPPDCVRPLWASSEQIREFAVLRQK